MGEVRELAPGEHPAGEMTCGVCGRRWDDTVVTGVTPVPAGRCPFEALHDDETVGDMTDASTVHVVWSSYGHTFLAVDDYQQCLTCGAVYELVRDEPTDPSHGAYVARDGSEAEDCSGNPEMVHGEAPCAKCEDDGNGCDNCQHSCNCLLCTG
jgi:hypothetical protein